MKNKKTKLLIIILCILIAVIIALYFLLFNSKNITGTIEYSNNAYDNEFDIAYDAPILIRNVEMVQYYKDENGNIDTVFANYQLDSFDDYINPVFNDEYSSKVFHDELSINLLY